MSIITSSNVSCAQCGVLFHKTPSKQKKSRSGLFFCCRECKDKAQRIGGIKAIRPAHYGAIEYREYCLYCKTKIPKHRCRRRKYCSHSCSVTHKKEILYLQIEGGDVNLPTKNYKHYLIDKFGEKCQLCGWGEKNIYSNTIPIELEHIDGNSLNNELKNLLLLCPNCHSLTKTYKALNRGKGRYKRRLRYQEGKSY